MIWLSISEGSGPEECAHAAVLTLQIMLDYIGDTVEVEQRLRPLYNFKAAD